MSNTSILSRVAALAAILVIPAVSACADLQSSERVARMNDNPYTSDVSSGTTSNEPNWQSFRYYGP